MINKLPKIILERVSSDISGNKRNIVSNIIEDKDAATIINEISHVLDNVGYIEKENFSTQEPTKLATETNCQIAICDIQEDIENANQGLMH